MKAIEEANAEKIIILPNNGNIVMATEQAASVVDRSYCCSFENSSSRYGGNVSI